MKNDKTSLHDLSPADLKAALEERGHKRFRAQQIQQWAYQRFPTPIEEMTNLGKEMRAQLGEWLRLERLEAVRTLRSKDGSTKYLFKLDDGHHIETVVMPNNKHETICMSTQVGCKMGCTFCVTGTMGFRRQLRTAEIVLQFLEAQALGHDISNIVLMGMGEPLDNWENLAPALRLLTHKHGPEVPERRITLSTVGLAARMSEVLTEFPRLGIAVSLVAPTQEERAKLLPVARKYPLDELMAVCRGLPIHERQRVTFEYAVLPGINDRPQDVKALTKLLHGLRCKMNLIPFNPDGSLPYRRPEEHEVDRFRDALVSKGVLATVRWSKALDVQGACGQLADRVGGI